jgi:hypothetical protein
MLPLIRWSHVRVVAFEDAAWHEDGFTASGRYRVYAMRQIHGLNVLPDAAGRRRLVYLACVHRDGAFRLLGSGATLRSAQAVCARYEQRFQARTKALEQNITPSGVLLHADGEKSPVVPGIDRCSHSPGVA